MAEDNETNVIVEGNESQSEGKAPPPPPVTTGEGAGEDRDPPGFMTDTRGNLIAEKNISEIDKLMDQTVRVIVSHAEELSAQIGRFKAHTVDDMDAFLETIREKYGSTRTRGAKGNFSLTSYDGLLKVTDKSSDMIDFGPELQIAKELLDELLEGDFGKGASNEMKILVQGAFETSTKGTVNRDAILRLRRYEFDHPKWPAIQQAITDSMRSLGRKSSILIHKRDKPDGQWKLVPLDVSKAGDQA